MSDRPAPVRTESPNCSASTTPSSRRRWAGSPAASWPRPSATPAASASSRPPAANSTTSATRSRKMRDLTDKPFGVNIAQAFVRDPGIVDFVIDQGVRFVTTSAGDPTKYTAQLKAAGLTVFHVVPTLAAALKAVAAGVDGLVVEGGEGGGFKNPRDVAIDGAAPARRQQGDGAHHRRRWHHRRLEHGGRVRARAPRACRWARAWSAPPSRRCTTTGSRRSSPRPRPTPCSSTGSAEPGLRALRTERTTRLEHEDHVDMAEFAQRPRPLLRRRHGGGDRTHGSGGGPHRVGRARRSTSSTPPSTRSGAASATFSSTPENPPLAARGPLL